MIAKVARIIAQRVHRGDHGMADLRAAAHRLDIAHRAALQEIAVVEQQAGRNLGPGLGDQAGGAGQTGGGAGVVGIVIPRGDVHVQIRGRKDAQPELPFAARIQRRGPGQGWRSSQGRHDKVRSSIHP